ncbi:MAG: helix-turn-helix domain-containing protein [Treponema sp.]|nr:helix-turn-helix domain-containing protein [Treponema sp.]MCL2270829.1 helix-turn-helix domain-containing protein [Treponema sp.]
MKNVNILFRHLAYFFYMGFKENFKSELLYQDIQVKELAEITGISRYTLGNYLSVRERIPTADVAVKIAQALGVSVEYLVTGEEHIIEKSSFGPEIRGWIQNYKQLSEDDQKLILAMTQLLKNKRLKK